MENRNYIDELVVKSLQGHLSEEEEATLAAWLNAGEPNRTHYEALEHAWRLAGVPETVSAIAPEEEWECFRHSTRTPLYRRLGSLAVAATVLLLIVVGWFWLSKNERPASKPVVQKEEAPHFTTRKQVNSSDTTQLYLLPDGSQVWLSANSELSWQEPFAGKHREVYLKGIAQFKAAKDSTRPFTVLGSKLSVTALGTLFTVTDQEKARLITVRLYEGKVLVQLIDSTNRYLLPGQELVYDQLSKTVKVQRFTKNNTVSGQVVEAPDDIILPYNDRGNWYMFNNQSLGQVFDQLEEIYEVDIVYNPADLQRMYFIGKFSKSDSIETILKQIATLNHLTVVKENNTYSVRK